MLAGFGAMQRLLVVVGVRGSDDRIICRFQRHVPLPCAAVKERPYSVQDYRYV